MPRPDGLVALLNARGATVATAESVTGGAVCAALVSVPGASSVVRGGIVAYTAAMKQALLGVDPDLISAEGVVSEAVAGAMARGVREATGASFGVATTGVAGPDPHDGVQPGRLCLAVSAPDGTWTGTVSLAGDRDAVRAGAVDAALDAVAARLDGDATQL
ncbi:CinA family protein [Demequina mangrovi]|uniref:Nicotinamide-nucleotide amidase n=1 Tax=Demequina mangrovi TaxID=1043493 RepID=A0A1H6ZDW4_9MICO|nr:CinA family protein [Demequina mangrovi]SEJ47710.1 nicotinamide-nucleotide amidase [Demequina mangrovi]